MFPNGTLGTQAVAVDNEVVVVAVLVDKETVVLSLTLTIVVVLTNSRQLGSRV